MKVAAALVPAIVVLFGCGIVEQRDLVGTWIVAAESRESLSERVRYLDGKIRFEENGDLVLTRVPGDFLLPSLADVPVSGSGRWRIDGRICENCMQLDVLSIAPDLPSPFRVPFGTQLFFLRSLDGDLRLCYFRGDPDSMNRGVFEKVPTTEGR